MRPGLSTLYSNLINNLINLHSNFSVLFFSVFDIHVHLVLIVAGSGDKTPTTGGYEGSRLRWRKDQLQWRPSLETLER